MTTEEPVSDCINAAAAEDHFAATSCSMLPNPAVAHFAAAAVVWLASI